MDFLSTLDPIKVAMLTFAVIGSVKLIGSLFEKDYKAAITIVVSALVGAVGAPFVGVAWFAGLVVGLNASGLVTTATRVAGGK